MIHELQQKLMLPDGFSKKLRIAIVRTDYHTEMLDRLENHCIDTLTTNGVLPGNIKTFTVPGSWEIPLMAQRLAESNKYDAIITFGIIIKGETHHFDMIANEVGRALMQVSLDYSIPVALEVLAVYEKKHAEARSGDNEHNKGIEGATAVLKMLYALQNE